MSIRIKAAAIIIMIAFTVTMATFPLNPIISKNGLDGAIGRDFFLASEIKDNFFAAGSSLDASFIFLAVGLLAAFIIFGLAARSFNKIKEQKAEMEKLNEKVLQQATQVKDECECAKIMLNAMPLACHIWDKNYQLFDCNDANLELFGISNKQDLIDNFYDFSPQTQPDGWSSRYATVQCINKAFAEGKYVFEWMHQSLDGTLIPTEITLVRVIYGNEFYVAGYIRDLRKADQDLNNFPANTSHETHVPFNTTSWEWELAHNNDQIKTQEKIPKKVYKEIYNAIYEGVFEEIFDKIHKEILKEARLNLQKKPPGQIPPKQQDKQIKRLYSDRKNDSRRNFSQGMAALGGLDIKKGIERFGGDENAYFDVLRFYAKNTPTLLDAIKVINKDSLVDYAAIIHGIRSSSRSICADEFADIAEALEKAAKAGDYDYVSANNAAFLEAAWKLVAGMDEMLKQLNAAQPKPRLDKPDHKTLSKMLAACRTYDVDAVYNALAELEKYDYTSGGGLVAWLSENVLQMNFIEIIEMLSSLDE